MIFFVADTLLQPPETEVVNIVSVVEDPLSTLPGTYTSPRIVLTLEPAVVNKPLPPERVEFAELVHFILKIPGEVYTPVAALKSIDCTFEQRNASDPPEMVGGAVNKIEPAADAALQTPLLAEVIVTTIAVPFTYELTMSLANG